MPWNMPSDEVPPHQTVEVGFTNNDYVNVCDTYGGGHKLLDSGGLSEIYSLMTRLALRRG